MLPFGEGELASKGRAFTTVISSRPVLPRVLFPHDRILFEPEKAQQDFLFHPGDEFSIQIDLNFHESRSNCLCDANNPPIMTRLPDPYTSIEPEIIGGDHRYSGFTAVVFFKQVSKGKPDDGSWFYAIAIPRYVIRKVIGATDN